MRSPIAAVAPALLPRLAVAGALVLPGCIDDGPGSDNESEVITTVRLTFTPPGGGAPVVAAFTDPDGDGGVSGMADPIALGLGITFDLGIELLDELQDPVQDITAEVKEEAEEHQVFVTGTAVEGPATVANPIAPVLHSYGDVESNYGDDAVDDDLPVGLANTITARVAGTGTFVVTLRHLPEIDGRPQKVAGLAERLAAGEPLPGEVDASVEFELTVQ
jgi:hypothetical protein